MNTENFAFAVKETLANEGVFSNDGFDPGGKTKWGITEVTLKDFQKFWLSGVVSLPKSYESCLEDADMILGTHETLGKLKPIESVAIENLSKTQAVIIYWYLFWNAGNINRIVNKYIAAEVFDTAVNCGVWTSCVMFQKALNFLSPAEAQIKDDGNIGYKETLPALDHLLSAGFLLHLLYALNGFQFMHYVECGKKNDFLRRGASRGWMRRLRLHKDLDTEKL
jgi:lysozyme family protein